MLSVFVELSVVTNIIISGCVVQVKIQFYFLGWKLLDFKRPIVLSLQVLNPSVQSLSVQAF